MSADTPGMPGTLPRLQYGSVVLRGWRNTDAAAVLEAAADPFIPLITTVPATGDAAAALAYIQRQQARLTDGEGYSFVIAEASTDKAVGQIGLWLGNVDLGRASGGYWVLPAARRRGLAGDALTALADWGLSVPGVERLEVYVEPWNEGSWRAAERAGFLREGLLRHWQRVGDERRDMYVYSRLATDTAGVRAT